MVILASGSPRRQELLRAVGVEFRVVVPQVEEPHPASARGRYAALVRRAALAKADWVAARESGLILAADTLVVSEGEALGKPADVEEARRMLARLSGRWHRVYTGVALVQGDRRAVEHERSEVAFRRLSNEDIERYIGSGEPMDKAGAYAIQGEGAALVRALRGCYTNVIGLPLPKLLEMLAEFEEGAAWTRGAGQ